MSRDFFYFGDKSCWYYSKTLCQLSTLLTAWPPLLSTDTLELLRLLTASVFLIFEHLSYILRGYKRVTEEVLLSSPITELPQSLKCREPEVLDLFSQKHVHTILWFLPSLYTPFFCKFLEQFCTVPED